MRVSQPSAAPALAAHEVKTSAVHGAVGEVVGDTDAETLTNKILGSGTQLGSQLDANNQEIADLADLIFAAGNRSIHWNDAVARILTIQNIGAGTALLNIIDDLDVGNDLSFKSATANKATLAHSITAPRTYTFPDVTDTVAVLAAAQTLTNKKIGAGGLEWINQGAGGDVRLECQSPQTRLRCTGHLEALQTLEWLDGGATRGRLRHSNSVDREYTFPDVSDTVAMLAAIQTLTNKTLTTPTIAQILNVGTLTLPTTTGTLALWNADNPPVTQYYSLGGAALCCLTARNGANNWTYDPANLWVESGTIAYSYLPVNLPHGATVTALRVVGQSTGAADLEIILFEVREDNGAQAVMAQVTMTTSMGEVSDTTVAFNPINNDDHSYMVSINHSANAAQCRLRHIQIDYTVVRPQA